MAPQSRNHANGPRLRELREEMEASIRDLAAQSGVDATTIVDLEHGRRAFVYLKTLKALAAALSVLGSAQIDWTELVRKDEEPSTSKRRRIRDRIPPRSSLDEFVAAERKLGTKPLQTETGAVPPFGPKALVETFTAYAAHAGERYYVTGEVISQRGLGFSDCAVLGIDHAVGARFEVARELPGTANPFAVTLITLGKEQTLRMQHLADSGDSVTAIIRLIATKPLSETDESVCITGLDLSRDLTRARRFKSETWSGFEPIQAKGGGPAAKPRPWALIVEEILSAG